MTISVVQATQSSQNPAPDGVSVTIDAQASSDGGLTPVADITEAIADPDKDSAKDIAKALTTVAGVMIQFSTTGATKSWEQMQRLVETLPKCLTK